MLAFFPILDTLLKRAYWYRQQLLFRFFFYLNNRSKMLSFNRCLQFWEKKRVSGGKVWWIRWLSYDYGCVFDQKLTPKHRCVSCCVIMIQNPCLVFPQFCAFPRKCFAQSAHNFKVVCLIDRATLWQEFMMHTTPLQSKKTVSKTFTFDRASRAYFDLGSSGRFHWDDWALVSMS